MMLGNMKHSEFVIERGQPKCLTRGFEYLKQNTVTLKIQTIEYIKERQFRLVTVDEFDPAVKNDYPYTYFGQFYADSITGTLYDPKTGQCLSSTQIKLLV